MSGISIEQAIYGNRDAGGYRFIARSPGFRDDWLAEAERLCTGFGERPAGVVCPSCVFAQPFGKRHVAVVQVADRGSDDAGRPGAMGFRLLVLPRTNYLDLGGDPFLIAEQFPPSWQTDGELPTLAWAAGPPPRRTVEQVREVIRRPESAALLGGAQALVDGGRVVFQRSGPDDELLRSLWILLPSSTRSEIWPASFAFGNSLGFHTLVLPSARVGEAVDYLTEDQVAEYPEGRYELSVQAAAEEGDQRELDQQFARRSTAETWRLVLLLLSVIAVLLATIGWLNLAAPLAPQPLPPPAPRLDLPGAHTYPPLTQRERQRLTEDLELLARELGETPPAGTTAEQWLVIIDERLGTPDRKRDPGRIADWGPPKRQLQALLWKHGIEEYHDERLNTCELVERLRNKVVQPPREGRSLRDR